MENATKARLTEAFACAIALLATLLAGIMATPATAGAATINVVEDASTIVNTSLQIKLDYDDMTVAWGSGISGKVINGADISNGSSSHYLFLVEREDADSWTLTNVCTITFANAATIGGRSIDVTITVNELSFGVHYGTDSDESESWVEFAYLNSSNGRLLFGSTHVGYMHHAQNYADVTTTITWSDTGATVDLPFFTVISDLDAGSSSTYTEAWTAVSGFSEFWVYEGNYLSISGTTFSSTYHSTTGTASFTETGVYAATTSGSYRCMFLTGACMTGYTLYCTYFDSTMDEPEKTADVETVQAGDTVTWTITEDFGEFLVDMVTCYSSWKIADALPDGLSYVSATVTDSSGTDLTKTAGTLSYDSSTNTVSFSFGSSWLADESNYQGQTITMKVVTTVDADASGTLTNEATLNVSGIEWSASDTVEVLAPSLAITKSVAKSSYDFGESMVWTVTVANTGDGTAENVVVVDALPDGLVLAAVPTVATSGSATGARVSSGAAGDDEWEVVASSLAAGASITVTFTTTAPVASVETSYTNTAKAAADYLDAVQATATTKVAPATGTLQIAKTVTGGTSVTASQDFLFTVSAADAGGDSLTGSFDAVKTSASGSQETTSVSFADGTATVSLKAGESIEISGLLYGTTFSVSEGSYPGYTTTSSGAAGTIGAGTTSTAAFVNAYAATGSWSPAATKTLDDATDDLVYYTFEFVLADADGNVVASGTSDETGAVSFSAIDYTTADLGTHAYTMYEVDGGDADIDYDDAIVQVEVTVEDNGDGTLSISAAYDGVATLPAFANLYAEHDVVLPATGQAGITAGMAIGGALVVAGVVVALAAMRRARAKTARKRR